MMKPGKQVYRTGQFTMKALYPPKFQAGQHVTFTVHSLLDDKSTYSAEDSKTGKIWIIDEGGAFGFEEHTYDIYNEEENCLYKHIREECIRPIAQ